MTTLPLNAPLAPRAPATPQNFVVYSEVQRMPLSKGWSQFMLMCRCFTHPSDEKKPTPTSRSRTSDFILTNRRTHSHLTNRQFHEQTVSFTRADEFVLTTDLRFTLTNRRIHAHDSTDSLSRTDGFIAPPMDLLSRTDSFMNRRFHSHESINSFLRSHELIVTNNSSRWLVLLELLQCRVSPFHQGPLTSRL